MHDLNSVPVFFNSIHCYKCNSLKHYISYYEQRCDVIIDTTEINDLITYHFNLNDKSVNIHSVAATQLY